MCGNGYGTHSSRLRLRQKNLSSEYIGNLYPSCLLTFSPIPVNVDDADKNKLIRTSPQPIPPREEEESFGGPSKYPSEPRARSYEHFKVTLQNYGLLLVWETS